MIFLDQEAILARHDPRRLVEALASAFSGGIEAPPRGKYAIGEDGTLLVMPAWRSGGDIGVKVVTVLPRNSERGKPTVDGAYMLLGEDGAPRAILEARTLTLVRTAAVSALAASRLARTEARTMLMVGAGALAPHLIRAHSAVFAFDGILIWARRRDQAVALAEFLRAEGRPVEAVDDLADAQARAQVISCATLAQEPLVHGRRLAAGTHVDLVGGFRPDMREADDDVVGRARIVTDTLAALDEAGDLSAPIASGLLDPGRIVDLPALLAEERSTTSTDLTMFKSVGTAIADLAAAEFLVERGGDGA